MILSDRELRAALVRESVRITPDPRADSSLWSSTALDLRLDRQLTFWDIPEGAEIRVSPGDADFLYAELAERYTRVVTIPDEGYPLRPGEFCLAWTLEKIQLPHRARIAARVEGKSTLARLGIGVHVTAPTIHAGFGYKPTLPDYPGSPIRLEIWNIGPLQVVLKYGMRICQLIFEIVDGTPEQGYEGKFSVQGPQPPAPP